MNFDYPELHFQIRLFRADQCHGSGALGLLTLFRRKLAGTPRARAGHHSFCLAAQRFGNISGTAPRLERDAGRAGLTGRLHYFRYWAPDPVPGGSPGAVSGRPTAATGRFGKPHEQREQSDSAPAPRKRRLRGASFRNGPAPAHRPGSPTAGGHQAELGGLPAWVASPLPELLGCWFSNQLIRSLCTSPCGCCWLFSPIRRTATCDRSAFRAAMMLAVIAALARLSGRSSTTR